MKITIPEGYELPDNSKDGDTVEELVTFRVEGDSLVPMMLAGIELPADNSKEKESKAEDEAEGEVEEPETGPMKGGPMAGMGQRILGMA